MTSSTKSRRIKQPHHYKSSFVPTPHPTKMYSISRRILAIDMQGREICAKRESRPSPSCLSLDIGECFRTLSVRRWDSGGPLRPLKKPGLKMLDKGRCFIALEVLLLFDFFLHLGDWWLMKGAYSFRKERTNPARPFIPKSFP